MADVTAISNDISERQKMLASIRRKLADLVR
jgi:hypothetical protein